ncbi:unnamed protein product [Mortierella alpina]
MSLSTCTTASAATSQDTTATFTTLASGTVVSEVSSVTDVHSLMAAYKTVLTTESARPSKRGFTKALRSLVAFQDARYSCISSQRSSAFQERRLSSLVSRFKGLLDTIPGNMDLSSMQRQFVGILTSL